MGVKPGVVLVLLEQWTLTPERDMRALVVVLREIRDALNKR